MDGAKRKLISYIKGGSCPMLLNEVKEEEYNILLEFVNGEFIKNGNRVQLRKMLKYELDNIINNYMEQGVIVYG